MDIDNIRSAAVSIGRPDVRLDPNQTWRNPMPYLQLDVPDHYPLSVRRNLARRMGDTYAEVMQTSSDLVGICFRELGEGGVWQCGPDGPVPAAVLLLAIRRGRPPEQRQRLAEAMLDVCCDALDLDPTRVTVEFSQHAGDEIYRKVMVDGVLHGSLGRDWSPDETTTPLIESMMAEVRKAEASKGKAPAAT
jgi:phenylpyruvate tautomerase PptA (4-oxalocrotonate tautomerase family)